jgi:hypothetical protein
LMQDSEVKQMRTYRFLLLAFILLVYSCGDGSGLSESVGGSSGGFATGGSAAITSGSIEFVSATPQVIGIKGAGQTEISEILFIVKDNKSDPIGGLTVTFTMNGPNGGEFISPTSVITSVLGRAGTILNSGSVAGPVSITAEVTINGTVVKSSPAAISIGGGLPSATHFSMAASRLNLHGFVEYGIESTITAFVGDRFGNYNVLEGTSVSFYAEAGAIDRNNTLDAIGQTSVTIRTQAPMPADVVISATETTMLEGLNARYGLGIGVGPYAATQEHPRDGRVTILATIQGEEAFDDANANGVYDAGEAFTDLGEPFYDKNDDGIRDDGTGADPFEEYIDVNSNRIYDLPNLVWDGPNCPVAGCQNSKMIWADLNIQFTGNAMKCVIDPPTSGIAIADGGSRVFYFMVSDYNYNMPVSGTKIDVSHSGGGKLFGQTSYTIPDGVSTMPYEIVVAVADDDAGDASAADFFSIEFKVTSSEIVSCVTQFATGTVD